MKSTIYKGFVSFTIRSANGIFTTFILSIFIYGCSPGNYLTNSHKLMCDTIQIKRDLDSIVKPGDFRNYTNLKSLNKVAEYIQDEFHKISDSFDVQNFNFRNNKFKNIICSLNTDKKERIIIGAHYDVCGDQDGADDNASGIVGLLEFDCSTIEPAVEIYIQT